MPLQQAPINVIILSVALSIVIGALLLALAFVIMHLCGVVTIRLGKRRRRKVAAPTQATQEQKELPDEVLTVILTAAAYAALGETDTSRFRVVSFERIKGTRHLK